jgi:hypothetical protein
MKPAAVDVVTAVDVDIVVTAVDVDIDVVTVAVTVVVDAVAGDMLQYRSVELVGIHKCIHI